MSDENRKSERREHVMALLTARQTGDPALLGLLAEGLAPDEEATPAVQALLTLLLDMTDTALLAVGRWADLDPVCETPEEVLRVLALYLATEGVA